MLLQQWWHELTFLFQRLTWTAVLDILLVALLFYGILTWLQQTQGIAILRGMLVLVLAVGALLSIVDLPTFRWLVQNFLTYAFFAFPVIFAPEIRQALERLGRLGTLPFWIRYYEPERVIDAVAEAAMRMSRRRIGGLIVLERRTALSEYAATGVILDALLSPELLLQIFHPNTPLHDGAVLVRRGRIYAAACILPLPDFPVEISATDGERLGLRHQAAIGITQRTDAIAVVISEETGIISVAVDGLLLRKLSRERLEDWLQSHLVLPKPPEYPFLQRTRDFFLGRRRQ